MNNDLIALTAFDTSEWGPHTFFFDKREIRFVYQETLATTTTSGKRCLAGVFFRNPINIGNNEETNCLIVKENYAEIIKRMDFTNDA